MLNDIIKYCCLSICLGCMSPFVFAGTTEHVALPQNPTEQQQLDAGAMILSYVQNSGVSKISLDAGTYLLRQSPVVNGRELTIEGVVDANGIPQTVLQYSGTRNDYVNNGNGTYTRDETNSLLAVFQADPVNKLGMWQALKKVDTTALVASTPGSFALIAQKLTVNPYANADPTQCLQIPYANFGIMAQYGQVIVRNIHIRGARSSGAYGYAGIVELYDCLLMHNGWNGLDTTRKSSVRCERTAGIGNGNDGFGVHVDGVGTFINCYASNNGDDGFSPHDMGQMRLVQCVSTFNADRGIVAVGDANFSVESCHLYHNGGQNISFEQNARGYIWDVVADTPGANQPNARVISEAKINTYRLVDRNAQDVVPALSGCGKVIAGIADIPVDISALAITNLTPQWIQHTTYFQANQ